MTPMKQTNSDVWKWLVGITTAIVVGLVTTVYGSVNGRVTLLEIDRKTEIITVQSLKTDFAVLQQRVVDAQVTLSRIEQAQIVASVQLQALVNAAAQEAKWRDTVAARSAKDSQRWNAAMDAQPPVPTGKKK